MPFNPLPCYYHTDETRTAWTFADVLAILMSNVGWFKKSLAVRLGVRAVLVESLNVVSAMRDAIGASALYVCACDGMCSRIISAVERRVVSVL